MIPIPQYPLYSASLTAFQGQAVPYPLDEDTQWGLSVEGLKTSVETARAKGIDVRSLVVINPGNPTGQCLSYDNIKEIVEFCAKERVILFADEVYQTNVYDPARPFTSFKKVVCDTKSNVELVSFHSVSKGMIGECGRRGGYFECHNIDEEIKGQLYKLASISLCPSVHGQVMVDLMVNPPKKGDESFESYTKEVSDIYQSLKARSQKLVAGFNKMEGITCNQAQGAMYAFPQIRLSKKAVEAAKAAGKNPDVYYCLAMLDATGVVSVAPPAHTQKKATSSFFFFFFFFFLS